jgi:hypothetical protein
MDATRRVWSLLALAACAGGRERPDECADWVDNDRDLLWDWEDPDCLGISSEPETPVDPGTETSETETSETDCEVGIGTVDATCTPGGNRVNIAVDFEGGDQSGELFLAETAVTPPLWAENHPLALVDTDDCGGTVEASLQTGAEVGDWVPGTSTLFGCADHVEGGTLTYVAKLGDAGCVAWGDDPEGLVAGVYDDDLVNEPQFSFAGCEVLP